MGRRLGKKSAGPSRTMTISLRLSPRIHFGLDLLTRTRHSTLTAVIEWAVTRAIEDEIEGLVKRRGGKAVNVLDETWDVDEADRFVKLAQKYPQLLRFDEDRLWKGIKETPQLWSEKTGPQLSEIRQRWPALRAHYLEGKV